MRRLVEQWRSRRRLITLFAIIALGCIGIGLGSIAEQIYDQPRRQAQFIGTLKFWSETLILEIPADDRDGWDKVADQYPEEFIIACTTH
jgi:hypothetical protein